MKLFRIRYRSNTGSQYQVYVIASSMEVAVGMTRRECPEFFRHEDAYEFQEMLLIEEPPAPEVADERNNRS